MTCISASFDIKFCTCCGRICQSGEGCAWCLLLIKRIINWGGWRVMMTEIRTLMDWWRLYDDSAIRFAFSAPSGSFGWAWTWLKDIWVWWDWRTKGLNNVFNNDSCITESRGLNNVFSNDFHSSLNLYVSSLFTSSRCLRGIPWSTPAICIPAVTWLSRGTTFFTRLGISWISRTF